MSTFLQVEIGYFFDGLRDEAEVGPTPDVVKAAPPTRHTIKIGQLAPRLSARQQSLALELIRTMAERQEGRLAA